MSLPVPTGCARSTRDLLGIIDDLEKRGIDLIVLSMGSQKLDTRTSTGKLMITVIGAMAAFERELLLERQKEGIALAKAQGKYKGRKPAVMAKTEDVIKLKKEGLSIVTIAEIVGIPRSSVYRCPNKNY
ncbi:DNA-invertase hin [Entomobacter blattae]|uniref:DNA-invertase hin n=1 Tax=Entomobacter blattae TaxID=2762277 RepID=A0A7H1NRJ5_9PROT|nr:DNA-invertase hin [Entomobacter blattae]